MKKSLLLAIVSILLFAAIFASLSNLHFVNIASASLDKEEWPMFCHDPAHTGYSNSTAPDTNKSLWTYTTGGAVMSSPAVADGKLYIGSRDDNIYCLNASTGAKIWNYSTGGDVDSGPAYYDGKIYVGSLCLNASTGALMWSYSTGYVYSSATIYDGKVYVGSMDHYLYCLNASDGTTIWASQNTGFILSSPAVADDRVFIGVTWGPPPPEGGEALGKISCFNASAGSEIWSSQTTWGTAYMWSSPAVAGDKVYIGGDQVFCFNVSDGTTIWSYAVSSVSTPVVHDGRVYVGTSDNKTYCLDASNGTSIWNYTTVSGLSSPALAEGKVYVNSDQLYCLNALTGTKVWSYSMAGGSSPAVAYGRLYVGSSDNKVYAFQDDLYNLTITAAYGGTTDPEPGTHGYKKNSTVTVTATPSFGYTFDHWELDASNVGSQNPITVTMDSDHVLNAVFTYSVTVDSYCYKDETDPGVSIIMDGSPTGYTTPHTFAVTGIHNFTLPDQDPNGHFFKQWNTYENSTTIIVTSAGTYTAFYQAKYNLTITTTTGGTTEPPSGDYSYWNGTAVEVSGYPNLGYALDHWELDGKDVGAENPITIIMDSDHTLNATFKILYILDITANEGGTTDPATGLHGYTDGTVVPVTAIPSTDYGFDHWELDGSWSYLNPIDVTMDSNHTLQVIFNHNVTIEAFCITENVTLNLDIIMDNLPTNFTTPHTFTIFGTHNFTVPENDTFGHFFEQWSTGETNTTITVATPPTLTAYYKIKWTLTIESATGGTTDPFKKNEKYFDGITVNVTALPSLGYLFDHWLLDSSNAGSLNPISIIMSADHALQPVFSWVGICNLTISATTGGTTNPTPATYSYTNGTLVEATAIPDNGYGFHHWDLDGSGNYSNPITVTMDSNHTLTAVFKLMHVLNITTTLGGITDPSPGSYLYLEDTAVNVTATPDTKSNFDHWELDGSWNYSNPITVTMKSDHALHAVFKFNITILALCEAEEKYVSVEIIMDGSPTGYYTPHTFTVSEPHSFTVPAADDAGHPFYRWENGPWNTTITVHGGTYTAYYNAAAGSVGGENLPIDKVRLLIPYIGLTSAIVATAAATAAYTRRRKPKSTSIAKAFSGKGNLFENHPAPRKKMASALLISALLAVLLVSSTMPAPALSIQPPVATTTYYIGTIGQPVRLDPARAYDTASGELLQNIYQTLIWWNDKHPVTFTPGVGYDLQLADYANLDQYAPALCTEVPTWANGRIVVYPNGSALWRFTINTAAMFQPWTDHLGVVHPARAITAADVVYSFRRQVVYDSPYGPAWMWMEPAFGCASWRSVYGGPYSTYMNYTFVDTADELACGVQITNWCYAVGNDVYFNFTLPWAEGPLKQIFSQTWGGVVNPDWVKEMGGWDGLFVAGWTNNYHGKPTSTRSELDTYKDPAVYGAAHGSKYASFTQVGARGAIGTGPYKFTSWDTTTKIWRIDYDPAYWLGWANAGDKAGGYFLTVIWKGIDSWPTRKMLFLEGESDVCAVPRANMYDLLVSTYNPIAGINLVYNIAALQNDVMLFGFSVPSASPYQSYVGYPTHTTGAQQFFFNNTHIRRAFSWALNYTSYVQDAWFGEGILQRSWWVDGLSPASFKNTNSSMPQRNIDLTQMQNELNQAVIGGHNVGTDGFEMTLAYNIGNEQRKIACNLIAQAFASLGSKYKCNVVGLDWPVFLEAENKGYLPMYDAGMLASFADPDDFCEPYQASWGAFCSGQFHPVYNAQPEDQAFVDAEISAAMIAPDFIQRGAMYKDLQYRYWLDVPSFPLIQPVGRRFARDWVQGWYFNALYPGLYAYDLYKSTVTTVNVDVDMTATVTPATPTYNPVYIFHSQMRIGNGNPAPARMTYNLHVKRNADASGITTLYTALGLRRVSATDDQFANATYVLLLNGGDASASVIWWEDGTNQVMRGSTTGISYTVSGVSNVFAPSNAVDNVPANNVQAAGALVAKTLTGDVTGNGFVDIFDAIQLANAFGTSTGQKRYNADVDLNGDGSVDIFDAILLAGNFNKHVP